ncbi:aspartyl/asparaginyl beta-hydroxylase-like [Sorex fumeus]|uniref:aspartyl/asparaginyl beta-hydroxylase-like n=1 Tax=Sorex fumeus TaxID=62283 RepID=UPI0024AE1654|nr:aspartyl/asparaginyl beta-hydroxylase-like [Sorex fumeus]
MRLDSKDTNQYDVREGNCKEGETKHGGHKNGRKGGISGSSLFTWFMVIALLGVWMSVAVIWFELVDYEEVLGKLEVYDANGDGDFDVEDAKVLLDFKERCASEPNELPDETKQYPWLEEPIPESRGNVLLQEDDEPTREQEPEDNFLRASTADDNFEAPDTAPFYEDEISYQVEDDTAISDYNQNVDKAMYEQENPDASEHLGTKDERILQDAYIHVNSCT